MTATNKWYVLILVAFIGLVLYLLAPVLTPFMIAAILAYIGDPLVDRLETLKLPRTLAVVIVFVVLSTTAILALIILVPMIEKQIVTLGKQIPGYIEAIQTSLIPWLNSKFGLSLELDLAAIKQSVQESWKQAGGVATTAISYVTRSGAV